MAFLPPANVPLHLILWVEALTFDQAFSEAQGQGCIISPLARLEVEGATADHVGNGREASRRLELQSCPQGVASGKSEQAAPISFELFYAVRHSAIIVLSPRREPSGFDRAFPGTASAPLSRCDEAL